MMGVNEAEKGSEERLRERESVCVRVCVRVSMRKSSLVRKKLVPAFDICQQQQRERERA